MLIFNQFKIKDGFKNELILGAQWPATSDHI